MREVAEALVHLGRRAGRRALGRLGLARWSMATRDAFMSATTRPQVSAVWELRALQPVRQEMVTGSDRPPRPVEACRFLRIFCRIETALTLPLFRKAGRLRARGACGSPW